VELLRTLLSRTLGLGGDKPEPVLDELSLEGVSRFLKSDRCKNIVCMVGAGISTCGTPGCSGGLSGIFFGDPPDPPHPSPQNIDTLERVAGLDPELLVEAHGTFFTSHCLRPSCRQRYGLAWMRERIFSSLVPKCEKCQGLVKPDIVFFGENLPSRFFTLLQSVSGAGGALTTPPQPEFGVGDPPAVTAPSPGRTLRRDVAWLGDCDSGCLALAELLGWKEELEELVRREHAAIDAKGEDRDGGSPKKSRG
ncbi:SIR2 deacetylase, partial [Dasyornis broadbenti]|nr:SIR2 deacetylase [Dasyornis broadbenti]